MPWSLDTCSIQCSPFHRVRMHGISSRNTLLYPPENNSPVHLTTTTEVRRSGRIADGMWSDWRTPRDSVLSSQTSAPTLLEWSLSRTARVPLNRLCTGVGRFRSCLHKMGVWPLLRLVSVEQRNNPLTMLSFTVQSIDLPIVADTFWSVHIKCCFHQKKTSPNVQRQE